MFVSFCLVTDRTLNECIDVHFNVLGTLQVCYDDDTLLITYWLSVIMASWHDLQYHKQGFNSVSPTRKPQAKATARNFILWCLLPSFLLSSLSALFPYAMKWCSKIQPRSLVECCKLLSGVQAENAFLGIFSSWNVSGVAIVCLFNKIWKLKC